MKQVQWFRLSWVLGWSRLGDREKLLEPSGSRRAPEPRKVPACCGHPRDPIGVQAPPEFSSAQASGGFSGHLSGKTRESGLIKDQAVDEAICIFISKGQTSVSECPQHGFASRLSS